MLKNINFANGEFIIDSDNINYRVETISSEPVAEICNSNSGLNVSTLKKIRFPVQTDFRLIDIIDGLAVVVMEGVMDITPHRYLIDFDNLRYLIASNEDQYALFKNGKLLLHKGDTVELVEDVRDSSGYDFISQGYGRRVDNTKIYKVHDFKLPDYSVDYHTGTRLYVDLIEPSPVTVNTYGTTGRKPKIYYGISTLKLYLIC